MKTLIIDNYDSFTYNIYQLVALINSEKPIVIANDRLSWSQIQQANFDNIIISPGPGNPENREDFGVCERVLLNSQIPILGICLGHQGLGYCYGNRVVKAEKPFHGRVSEIYHQNDSLFASIPSPFKVVRYHSLVLKQPVCEPIKAIARTKDNLVMAIKHQFKPFWGVQFHPESIASEFGKQLLINFNRLSWEYKQKYRSNYSTSSNNFSTIELNQNKPLSLPKKQPKIDLQIYSKKLINFIDPALVFQTFYAKTTNSFWLDSSMVASGLARFSYMGKCQGENSYRVSYRVENKEITTIENRQKKTFRGDIFNFLQARLDRYTYHGCANLPFDFNGGFVGYFGYELKSLCGTNNRHRSNYPDAQFFFVDKMLVFDHQREHIYLVYIGENKREKSAIDWFEEVEEKLAKLSLSSINFDRYFRQKSDDYRLSREKEIYLNNIDTCLAKIRQGESYEICLTNHLCLETIDEPLSFYLQVRKNNPVPYSAFFQFEEMTIVCSSPERFLKLDKQGYIESKPIKGTVKRGKNEREDDRLKQQLQYSEKERAENLMIVDLLRNDLGKICEIGSVNVPKLMSIETYSTVHQMVSTVRGKVKAKIKPLDCIRACFPGGSMTGAPKKRTMEIIDELETEARGIYSGSIGFIALNGTIDLNIVIRTAVITPEQTTIGIGGAITILSDPQSEFAEIILKAKALINN